MEYKGFTYTLTPKTAWDSLSMLEKSEMMKVAVRNGITDLKTIKEKYNEFAKGGYLDWKEKANKYKHLDIDNDRTYDYEGWYNENPQRAWDFLNDSPDAHFDDKYKTVYHPTFSTQSKYSGKKDATYNPLGLVGGTWNKQGTVFTMSPDSYKGPVSMDERAWYLMNAEDNGVQLRETDGSLPLFDGIPWGGVLPSVTVTGSKFAMGGDKGNNTPRPVTTGGAGYVPSMNQSAYRMVEKVGNLGKAAVKAGTKFIKDMVTQEPDAVRNAGIVYLQNLNPENRKVALDAVMHSSEGAHVMSGDAMLDTGLPNYVRAITGNPIQVNYTGSGIFDESKRDTEDGYYRPNLKRDMVNLYLKGDTTGFEDVTDNPYYQNGPDYKKYFRENYPGLSPKTYKMSSDQVPLLLYPNEYKEAINSIGKNIPVEADGWTEGGDNVAHYNRWYKMIDGKLMAIDSDVWDFNPKDWGWMGGNTDDPELVNSVGTPFILKAIRPVQQIGYDQKPISPNKKHSIGGPIVEAAMNEYRNGGKIHIKPENRGKFTALKKRTGHSATWFKEHGTPAQRKMATFALNARHWKHGLGGHLFDGGGKVIDVEGYPLVASDLEGLTGWFNSNPNVAGMAIGAGLNGIGGERRVVLNPNLKDSNARNSVYMNESYRHFFDANDIALPAITDVQREAYKGTSYEGLDRRIQETEAARYLSGDPSHHLNTEQKAQLSNFRFTYPGGTLPEVVVEGKKKSYGGYMEGGIYDIDIEELNRLISNGYEIELL